MTYSHKLIFFLWKENRPFGPSIQPLSIVICQWREIIICGKVETLTRSICFVSFKYICELHFLFKLKTFVHNIFIYIHTLLMVILYCCRKIKGLAFVRKCSEWRAKENSLSAKLYIYQDYFSLHFYDRIYFYWQLRYLNLNFSIFQRSKYFTFSNRLQIWHINYLLFGVQIT